MPAYHLLVAAIRPHLREAPSVMRVTNVSGHGSCVLCIDFADQLSYNLTVSAMYTPSLYQGRLPTSFALPCLNHPSTPAGEEPAAQADTEHVPAPPIPDGRHQAPAH